jgi:hypothetical protein
VVVGAEAVVVAVAAVAAAAAADALHEKKVKLFLGVERVASLGALDNARTHKNDHALPRICRGPNRLLDAAHTLPLDPFGENPEVVRPLVLSVPVKSESWM